MENELPTNDTTTNLDVTNTDMSNTDVVMVMTGDEFNRLVEAIEIIAYASKVVITWGIILVPLIILVLMLWWFFKQFLYRY